MKKEEINLLDFFPAAEGEINLTYGRIGNGKTTVSTLEIKRRLRKGEVVYANWKIDIKDEDERDSWFNIFCWFIGLKKKFTVIHCSKNLIYFPIDNEYARKHGHEDFVDWLSKLTDCAIFLDEGHLVLDSYLMAKQSLKQRAAVLHTRHFNRTINIVSQRPTAIHVTARANVNRFYRCVRPFPTIQKRLGIVFIIRQEFQDMVNETVDEEAPPVSTRWYWVRKKDLKSFDTKYMRQGLQPSQLPNIDVYVTERGDRWKIIAGMIRTGFARRAGFSRPAHDALPVRKEIT